jgi:predicted heme/steroid binding protein/uncharacterized membrane protein
MKPESSLPKLKRLLLPTVFLVALFSAVAGYATEQYAAATGADCRFCHFDPLGGGELTAAGKGYQLSLRPRVAQNQIGPAVLSRWLQLVAGYIHILTAFMWFGTILYVHLVLKPAYASKGLPRGEVRVGLASMAIMAVSGAVLTYYKVPSLSLLLSSRFGLLLLAKITIFAIMVLSALYVVLIIGPKLKNKQLLPAPETGEFSAAELAGFNGESGRPAYIAYRGRVYDVSGSRLWKDGSHMKRHQAGVDLTEILAQAPHGDEKILALPERGWLSDKKTPPANDAQRRVFYFMAYMNLGFVFLIALILALWRWY